MRRAIKNSYGPNEEKEGIDIIRKRYSANSYPDNIISRAVTHCKIETQEPQPPNTERLFLTLPFTTERHARIIRNSLRRCNLSDFLTVSFKSTTLSSILQPKCNYCTDFNYKYCLRAEKGESCMTKFCIYLIKSFKCPSFYVGESARTVRSRLREHVSVSASQVYQHLLSHDVNPSLGLIRRSILHSGIRHTDARRSVEASEISSRQTNINVQLSGHGHTL